MRAAGWRGECRVRRRAGRAPAHAGHGGVSRSGVVGVAALVGFRVTVAGEGTRRSQLRAPDERTLLEPRELGRMKLPSNVLGLLFHAAEHTQRHVGQVITTAKVVRKKE
jgi:hypothetical protein